MQKLLPDVEFSEYDRVLVTPERISSAYNSCLHSIWIPTVNLEDVSAESSSEEQMDVEDERQFWRQPPLLRPMHSCPQCERAWKRFLGDRSGLEDNWNIKALSWNALRIPSGIHAWLALALRPVQVDRDIEIVLYTYLLHLHWHVIHWGQCIR